MTHVGQTFLIFDWAFQTDPGNPELLVREDADQGLNRGGDCVNFGRCPSQPAFSMANRSRSRTWSASPASPVPALPSNPKPGGRCCESRRLVERAISSGQTIYGINTGFGKLANVRIPPDQLDQLQTNLIRSHAAGVGTPLPPAGGARRHAAPRQRSAPSHQRGAPGAGRGAGRHAQRRRDPAGAGAGERGRQR